MMAYMTQNGMRMNVCGRLDAPLFREPFQPETRAEADFRVRVSVPVAVRQKVVRPSECPKRVCSGSREE